METLGCILSIGVILTFIVCTLCVILYFLRLYAECEE